MKATKLFEVEATPDLYGLLRHVSNVWQRSGKDGRAAVKDRVSDALTPR